MRGRCFILMLLTLLLTACHTHPASVPGHMDPHHHVRFQNGYVRVIETVIRPNEETLDHSHAIEAAAIFLSDGEIRITYDDDSTAEFSLEKGAVAFGDSAIVHRVANTGKETVRVIAVEIFSRPPDRGVPESHTTPGEVLLENDKVVISRVLVPRDRSLELSQAGPSVIIPAATGTLDGSVGTRTLRKGQPLWHSPDSPPLSNSGDRTFDGYVVTLKPRPSG